MAFKFTWQNHKALMTASAVFTALLLFGFLESFGIPLDGEIFGIKATLIAVASQVYIALALWLRFI